MKNRPLLVGSVVAVLLAGLGSAGVASGRLATRAPHEIRISFPTGDGLVPGSDVFEAGAKVGSIASIEPQGARALVVVEVDDSHWPVHTGEGFAVGIRPKSLLGEKYVDLHAGAGSGTVDTGQVVQAPADSTPVELDQFINSLDDSARAAAKSLVNDLGAGVAGRGPDLNAAIRSGRDDLAHLAVFGRTLDRRDPDLDRIIVGLDGVLAKLTQSDQLTQLSQLISNGQRTLNAIEAEKVSFSRSFTDAQRALTDLNQALDPAIASLRDTIATAPDLVAVLGAEADQLAALGADVTTGNLIDIINAGLVHGPTTAGGALEHVNGKSYPIFRICLEDPGQTTPAAQNSCQGNGFNPGPADPVPASTSASGGNGNGMTTLVSFLGA